MRIFRIFVHELKKEPPLFEDCLEIFITLEYVLIDAGTMTHEDTLLKFSTQGLMS